jgi:hypothetical protein
MLEKFEKGRKIYFLYKESLFHDNIDQEINIGFGGVRVFYSE